MLHQSKNEYQGCFGKKIIGIKNPVFQPDLMLNTLIIYWPFSYYNEIPDTIPADS